MQCKKFSRLWKYWDNLRSFKSMHCPQSWIDNDQNILSEEDYFLNYSSKYSTFISTKKITYLKIKFICYIIMDNSKISVNKSDEKPTKNINKSPDDLINQIKGYTPACDEFDEFVIDIF